jgi:ribonuclease HII
VSVGVAVVRPDVPPPDGLADSKLLAERRRDALFGPVGAWCRAWAVGHADPGECDDLGMTAALSLAAGRALAELGGPGGIVPDALVVDGPVDYVSGSLPPGAPAPAVRTVVGGDRVCVSVAAASVLAKVVRDRLMRDLAPSFPAFDFDRNKGYPSPVHRRALAGAGLTSVHRRTWSYVRDLPFR